MVKIEWRQSWDKCRVHGRKYLPKKPVIWTGEAWLQYENGERFISEFRTGSPVLRFDAQLVIVALLDELAAEHGDEVKDIGFYFQVA